MEKKYLAFSLFFMHMFLCTGSNWNIGDLVWAKFLKRPWWPAMVYSDRNDHYEANGYVHVLFIDTAPTTAWVNSKYVLLICVVVFLLCIVYWTIGLYRCDG